jgi:hemoglobin
MRDQNVQTSELRRRLERFARPIAVVALACAAAAPASAEAARAADAAGSLYLRLGGYDFIAKFVDTAFPRVAGHPQLRRLFQGHSQDSQVRQRQLIIDALCQGTGGPCMYTGRAMRPVHTGLGITAADWSVFVGILGGALEELRIQPADRKEFLDLLEVRFRPGVVESP